MTIWHTGGGVYETTGQQVYEAMVSKIRVFEISKYRKFEISLQIAKILHKDELGVQFLGSSEVFCLTL